MNNHSTQKQNEKRYECCYPKDLVYPPSGEEVQLEELRAQLPCYQPLLSESQNDDACDMEMTVSYTANITTMIPSASLASQNRYLYKINTHPLH